MLALGGAPRWAAITTTFLAVAGAACYVAARRYARSPLVILLAVAAGLTALQWVPLPAGVVNLLAPGKFEIVQDNARSLAMPMPRYFAISYDPAATLLELVKLLGYVAFAVVGVRLAESRRRRRRIVNTVVVLSCFVAALAVIHSAADLHSVYGLVVPRGSGHQLILGPLVDPNHLAALLALAAPVAIGLAIEKKGRPRFLWLCGTVLLVAGTLLTRSRGGGLGLGVAVMVGTGMWWLQRKRESRTRSSPRTNVVAAAVVLTCALVLVATWTAGGLLHDFGATHSDELVGQEGKTAVWRKSATLVNQYPYTGVGRGAFGFAYTRLQSDSHATYTHVENEYLQAVVDWGIPGAALLAALLVLLVVKMIGAWRAGPVEAGIVAGLGGLAVHSAFDFALQIPGVALPAIALASAVLPGSLQRAGAHYRKRVAYRAGGITVVVACLLIAIGSRGEQAASESVDLQSSSSEESPRLAEAIEAWQRHPADYVMAGITAQQLIRAGDARSVGVLNRALFLNPKHPTLHELAARALYLAGKRKQSLVEMSLALEYTVRRRRLIDELVRMFPDPASAAEGVPLTDLSAALESIDLLQRTGHEEIARLAAKRCEALYPSAPELYTAIARIALKQGDGAGALAAAQQAQKLRPDAISAILVARATAATGDAEPAAEGLRRDLRAGTFHERTDRAAAYDALSEINNDLGRLEDARAALLEELSLISEPWRRARIHRRLATLEDRMGNHHRAELERKQAQSLESRGRRRLPAAG